MVGLRSGGTSLLFPWVGGWASPPLSARPQQPNFLFPSHLPCDGWVAQWRDLSFLLLPRRVPQARFGSRGLGVARSICDPAPTALAKWAKLPASTPKKRKICANDVIPAYESCYKRVLSES